jgi:hypothetical protein
MANQPKVIDIGDKSIVFDPSNWIPTDGQSTKVYLYASGVIGVIFATSLAVAIYMQCVKPPKD